ncbi:MAG: AzlD domain-containing protein [Cyanobacteria bacterium P01_D01_bin.105]
MRDVWFECLVIGGMAIATFSIRYCMFGFSRRLSLPPALLRALRYVPPVVLTAIVVPEVLLSEGTLNMSLANARLLGAIAAILASIFTQNLLFTIVLGMVTFFGWQILLGIMTQP